MQCRGAGASGAAAAWAFTLGESRRWGQPPPADPSGGERGGRSWACRLPLRSRTEGAAGERAAAAAATKGRRQQTLARPNLEEEATGRK